MGKINKQYEEQEKYKDKKPDSNALTDDQINIIDSNENSNENSINIFEISPEEKKNNKTINHKLTLLQNELKAPKNQYNNYGQYKYRNCEDILEAVKPLLLKYNLSLVITDSIKLIGDRFYLIAKGILSNIDLIEKPIEIEGIAREAISRKGMDDSQISGSASSYARKYMMNAMFLIDDTKDADNFEDEISSPPQNPAYEVFNNVNKQPGPNVNQIPTDNKTIYQAIMKLLRESKMSKDQKIKIKKGADALISDSQGLQELLNSTLIYIQGRM